MFLFTLLVSFITLCSFPTLEGREAKIEKEWIRPLNETDREPKANDKLNNIKPMVTYGNTWHRPWDEPEEHVFPSFNKPRSTIWRIVGGETIRKGEAPWMVSLQYYEQHFCAATLIADQWLVTAAHCVDKNAPQQAIAVVGEYDLSKKEGTEQYHEFENIFIHEKWDSSKLIFDIALIKLKEKVSIDGKYVSPIDLPEPDLTVNETVLCVATGWGYTDANTKKVSNLPQMIDLPIVDQQTCRRAYKQVYKGVICAGGQKDRGICSGDSGGPFQCYLNKKWVYVGLDSYTALCALPEYPSVFTYVPLFSTWVRDKISTNSLGF